MDQFALNLIMIIGFVLGSGLIILEAFMPGFGVAGVGGLLLEFAAIYCCWQLFGIGTALLAFAAVAVLIGIALRCQTPRFMHTNTSLSICSAVFS